MNNAECPGEFCTIGSLIEVESLLSVSTYGGGYWLDKYVTISNQVLFFFVIFFRNSVSCAMRGAKVKITNYVAHTIHHTVNNYEQFCFSADISADIGTALPIDRMPTVVCNYSFIQCMFVLNERYTNLSSPMQ